MARVRLRTTIRIVGLLRYCRIMLGGRSPSRVLREAGAPRNYLAFARMVRLAPALAETARRYFLGGGEYPWPCPVRTPLGIVKPTLYSHHDVWTVNEIFFREDYRVGPELRVAVDVGSNIGISALYFLSRSHEARCYLYEPEPRNVERLRANLEPYAGRWELEATAVGPADGAGRFARESTGRYGRLGEGPESIPVSILGVNRLLDRVLSREGSIDALKLDIEGLEEETVRAIRPDLLERIDAIYFESEHPSPLDGKRFVHSFAHETVTLKRLR